MGSGRNYSATTKEALFLLSRGNCYEPSCKRRVMEWAEDRWVALVDVAHIRGLKEGSPRHDGSDERELNKFRNLILLCQKHHKLVDGKQTWMLYSVETLTKWKMKREGNLADELGQVDWITQENLQDIMADAIDGMKSEILTAIDGIETISSETLSTLKELVTETLDLPYMSPEDIESLDHFAYVFQNVVPDYAPELSHTARILQNVAEFSGMLSQAGEDLKHLASTTDLLFHAAQPLSRLDDLMPQLTQISRSLNEDSIIGYQVAAQQIEKAVGAIESSANYLSGIEIESGYVRSHSEQPVAERVVQVPVGRRRFDTFRWGFASCIVFVVVVMSLLAFIVSHIHK